MTVPGLYIMPLVELRTRVSLFQLSFTARARQKRKGSILRNELRWNHARRAVPVVASPPHGVCSTHTAAFFRARFSAFPHTHPHGNAFHSHMARSPHVGRAGPQTERTRCGASLASRGPIDFADGPSSCTPSRRVRSMRCSRRRTAERPKEGGQPCQPSPDVCGVAMLRYSSWRWTTQSSQRCRRSTARIHRWRDSGGASARGRWTRRAKGRLHPHMVNGPLDVQQAHAQAPQTGQTWRASSIISISGAWFSCAPWAR